MAVEDVLVGRLRRSQSESHLDHDQIPAWVLSPEQMEKVATAISGSRQGECLSERYRIRITGSDLHTLTWNVWLNDEVRAGTYGWPLGGQVLCTVVHLVGDQFLLQHDPRAVQ